MIDLDDIARAARYADALAEEIGFEAVFARFDLDKDGLLYMQEQRALRMAMIHEGRDPRRLSRSQPVSVQLRPASRRLMPAFGAAWLDGFLTGFTSKHDSSHDIPGIG
jgi:hypothetical protein